MTRWCDDRKLRRQLTVWYILILKLSPSDIEIIVYKLSPSLQVVSAIRKCRCYNWVSLLLRDPISSADLIPRLSPGLQQVQPQHRGQGHRHHQLRQDGRHHQESPRGLKNLFVYNLFNKKTLQKCSYSKPRIIDRCIMWFKNKYIIRCYIYIMKPHW